MGGWGGVIKCSAMWGADTDWKMPSADSTAFVAVAVVVVSLVNTGYAKTRVSEGRLNDNAIGSIG